MTGKKLRSGMAMIMVILTLAISAVLLAVAARQNFFRSQAARASVAKTLAQSDASSAAQSMQRIISGPLREKLREQIPLAANMSNNYYFGSGDAASASASLSTLANRMQTYADSIFCSYTPPDGSSDVELRVYFTSTACGEPLPSELMLPQPRFTQGRESGFQEYTLPFIAIAKSNKGEFVGESAYAGEYRFGLGADSFARYALFVNNNYYPDGTPGYLRSWNVIEGPVHTNGILNVWGTPYVSGTVTTASCGALDPAGGCSEAPTPVLGLHSEGLVPASSLTPSPDAPCYPGGDCPTFAGGVDYAAPAILLPDETTNTPLGEAATNGAAISGPASSFLLSEGVSPLDGTREAQLLRIETPYRTWRLFQEAGYSRLWLESAPGENLVTNYDFSSNTVNGWGPSGVISAIPSSTAGVPAGAPTSYVAVMSTRDVYYSSPFSVSPGDDYDVSIEAASGTATGVTGAGTYKLQIGLRFIHADGTSEWLGTRDIDGGVVNDGSWHTSSGTITAPADSVEAQVWVQVDQPASEDYTFYFTNAVVKPVAQTEYSPVTDDFNGVVYVTESIQDLHGPSAAPALHASSKLTIATDGDVYISDNLYLADPPCSQGPGFSGGTVVPSVCTNLSATNTLGIYTHNGNILIPDPAPESFHIEASLMARDGWVGAENYDTRDIGGGVYVLGSITEDRYGLFGTNDASGTLEHGYNLTFVYDPRLAPNTALYPPAWPTHSRDVLYVVLSHITELK